MLINVTDLFPPGKLTKMELVSLKGKPLVDLPVYQHPLHYDLYNVSTFIPPDQFFYVKVRNTEDLLILP